MFATHMPQHCIGLKQDQVSILEFRQLSKELKPIKQEIINMQTRQFSSSYMHKSCMGYLHLYN